MAAQNGVATFITPVGTKSVSFYLDDTAGNRVRFDMGAKAGATSPDKIVFPHHAVLKDFLIAAASGQTHTSLMVGGAPTGDILLNAVCLASVTNRPNLGVIIPANTEFQAVQLA